MLTKMALIFHVYTGLGFFVSASNTMTLMESRFGVAMVTNLTTKNLFQFIGYLLSIGVGIVCWVWLGHMYDCNTLAGEGAAYSWIGIVMLIIMILMLSAPYIAMFVVVLVAIIGNSDVNWIWVPWCCGVFLGGITALFFETVGETVLVASDSTLVAMAIDEECLSKEEFEAKAAENPFMGFMVAEAVKAAEAKQQLYNDIYHGGGTSSPPVAVGTVQPGGIPPAPGVAMPPPAPPPAVPPAVPPPPSAPTPTSTQA